MLRKLTFAVFGAFLGAVVGLVPVVVDAQETVSSQPLRHNSEEDMVTVSRRVVGAESLAAPPGNKQVSSTGSLWMAVCATGVGVFGGWLLWGRRHEPEVVVHQLEPDLVDLDRLEDHRPVAGSLFGLSGLSAVVYQEDDTPAAPGDVLGVARTMRVLEPTVLPVSLPGLPDGHPPHQPAENWPADPESNQAADVAPAPPPTVDVSMVPVPSIESVLESQGLEVVDLDTTDLPWDFDTETSNESAAAR